MSQKSTRVTGADAAVLDESGRRILLQLRSDFRLWGLPGGAVEAGETVGQAVAREVKEEAALDVEVVRLVGVYSRPGETTTTYPSGDTVHYVSLVFECRVTGGRLRTNSESLDVRWFAADELPADVMPDHLPRIHDALARRAEPVLR